MALAARWCSFVAVAVACAASPSAYQDRYPGWGAGSGVGPSRDLAPRHVPELQVGCEKGSVHTHGHDHAHDHDHDHDHARAHGELQEAGGRHKKRNRRAFFRLWQPSEEYYQQPKAVPVYLPFWGGHQAGLPQGIPIYLPSTPIILNIGFPFSGRRQPAPCNQTGDRPPPSTPSGPLDSSDLGNKLGFDYDDRPVWSADDSEQSINSDELSNPPPLFHRPPGGGRNELEQRPATTTRRPAFTQPTSRRTSPPQRTTTQRPAATTASPGDPGRCVWAIVSCCSPNSVGKVRYDCFELLGCSGSIWDMNACSRESTLAALQAVQRYYDRQKT